ncbi:MAG TPA: hypothetical protein VMS21_07285 [Methylomirabilota bacterium]|nr:hypothetical protein [Methylomirabilota bacterium]
MALRRRAGWALALGLVAGAGTFAAARHFLPYEANAQLMFRELPSLPAADAYQPQSLNSATLLGLLRSPDLFATIATNIQPRRSVHELLAITALHPNPDSDLLELTGKGPTPASAVELVNQYARQAVSFTRERRRLEALELSDSLRARLMAAGDRLEEANRRLLEFSRQHNVVDVERETSTHLDQYGKWEMDHQTAQMELDTLDATIGKIREELTRHSPTATRLRQARDRLAELRTVYTDAHPDVISQRSVITDIEEQLSSGPTDAAREIDPGSSEIATTLYLQLVELETRRATLEDRVALLQTQRDKVMEQVESLSDKSLDYFVLKSGVESARGARDLLATRQREVQDYADSAQGDFRLVSEAAPEDVNHRERRNHALFLAVGAGTLVLMSVLLTGFLSVAFDHTLRTRGDVTRVTRLPVLATLGDLDAMDSKDREEWSFRTWTLLKGKLASTHNRGIVCGVVSCLHGEGRSTWINLLAKAAGDRGCRILAISTSPSSPSSSGEPPPDSPGDAPGESSAIEKNVLAFPTQVTEKLVDQNAGQAIRVPLAEWVWNPDRRRQWRSALESWSSVENLVMLIELPPASMPESVLLAENLPQVIWLTGSGLARTAETQLHLETLRHAGCNLVGAVLNREPSHL